MDQEHKGEPWGHEGDGAEQGAQDRARGCRDQPGNDECEEDVSRLSQNHAQPPRALNEQSQEILIPAGHRMISPRAPEVAVSFVGVVRPPSRAGACASSGCHHAETRTRRVQLRRRTQRVGLPQCCTRRTVTAARQGPATETCELLRRLGTSPELSTDETPRPTGWCRETGSANRAPDRKTHQQREAWEAPRRRIDPPPCHDRSPPKSLTSPPCGSGRALLRTRSRPTRTPRHCAASG